MRSADGRNIPTPSFVAPPPPRRPPPTPRTGQRRPAACCQNLRGGAAAAAAAARRTRSDVLTHRLLRSASPPPTPHQEVVSPGAPDARARRVSYFPRSSPRDGATTFSHSSKPMCPSRSASASRRTSRTCARTSRKYPRVSAHSNARTLERNGVDCRLTARRGVVYAFFTLAAGWSHAPPPCTRSRRPP